MLHIQPEHGEQPQLFHLVVNVGVHPVEGLGSQVTLPGQADDAQGQDVKNHAAPQHQPGKADVQPFKAQQPSASDTQQDGGQQEDQENGNRLQHCGDNDGGVVGELIARRHPQCAGPIVGLKNGLGDDLHPENHREEHRQHLGHNAVDQPPPGQGQGGEEQPARQGKGQVHRDIDQGSLHVDMEHQFQVEQQGREQQHPGHGLSQHCVAAAPGTAAAPTHPSPIISHRNQPPA